VSKKVERAKERRKESSLSRPSIRERDTCAHISRQTHFSRTSSPRPVVMTHPLVSSSRGTISTISRAPLSTSSGVIVSRHDDSRISEHRRRSPLLLRIRHLFGCQDSPPPLHPPPVPVRNTEPLRAVRFAYRALTGISLIGCVASEDPRLRRPSREGHLARSRRDLVLLRFRAYAMHD